MNEVTPWYKLYCRFPRDITSLVQRIGRAARDPKINSFGVLYAPPLTKNYPTDKNVRQYINNHITGKCLWAMVGDLFGTTSTHTCNTRCSACLKVERPPSYTALQVTRLGNTQSCNRGRWPPRSKEEKALALQTLLAWRKDAYEHWVAERPLRNGAETWILPENIAKNLSQKFSRIRNAEDIYAFASSCKWMPRGDRKKWFEEVAQRLAKLNSDIDDGHGLGNQMTRVSRLDYAEDSSDSDGDGSDNDENVGEGDWSQSKSDSSVVGSTINQPLSSDQPPPND